MDQYQMAYIFVKQLLQQGVRDICISPGSRSTPLVLACTRIQEFTIHRVIDERASAFMALGITQVTKEPVAVICTSGTAVANYLPAIQDATRRNLPLILLTADRPVILQDSGANQTMDQVKLFGNSINHFLDINSDDKLITKQYLEQQAAKVYYKSVYHSPGPVHVNFHFSKPLEPSQEVYNSFQPTLSKIERFSTDTSISQEVLENIKEFIYKNTPIIVLGPLGVIDDGNLDALKEFLKNSQLLTLAEPLSNVSKNDGNIIFNYDVFLQEEQIYTSLLKVPIMQIGALPTSSLLLRLLKHSSANKILVTNFEYYANEGFNIQQQFITNNYNLFKFLSTQNWELTSCTLTSQLLHFSNIFDKCVTDNLLSTFGSISVLILILRSLSTGSSVYLGNSLTVRFVSKYFTNENLYFFGNRGLSGIDGNIAMYTGIASKKAQVYLILGDVSFLHDLNSLHISLLNSVIVKIVVLNNSGGHIFDQLPIRDFPEVLNKDFVMSVNYNIELVSQAFGYSYFSISKLDQVDKSFSDFKTSEKNAVLEIIVDAKADKKVRRDFYTEWKNIIENDPSLDF